MLPFETVDHTADLALVARGRTLSELFENTALGMFAQLADLSVERPLSVEREWTLTADDLENLLIAWLRELLFEHETEERVFTEFEVSVEALHLTATARGGALLADEPLTDIKAVTYHDLHVVRHADHWEVKVVFDL